MSCICGTYDTTQQKSPQLQSRTARSQTKGKEPDAEGIRGRKTKTEVQNQIVSKNSLPANTSTSTPARIQGKGA